MKLGIMQPYFVPYIGYWQLINAVEKYVVYDDVNYIKGGWINRNRILVDGNAQYLSLKLKGASPNKRINEIHLFGDKIFNKKTLRTIEACYSKAPHYEQVYPIISDIINCEEEQLSQYLLYSIKKICEYLGITTEIVMSSTLDKDDGLKGQAKIIDICQRLGAREYYNAIGGKELYAYEAFDHCGIDLKFLESKTGQYKQYTNDFIPYLSIVDVMMFNTREGTQNLLNSFELLSNS